jgi:hypothetical protein
MAEHGRKTVITVRIQASAGLLPTLSISAWLPKPPTAEMTPTAPCVENRAHVHQRLRLNSLTHGSGQYPTRCAQAPWVWPIPYTLCTGALGALEGTRPVLNSPPGACHVTVWPHRQVSAGQWVGRSNCRIL